MKYIEIHAVVKINNQESFLYNPTYQLTFLRQMPLSSAKNVFFVKAGEQCWCFCLKVCISCNCVLIRCYKVWCFTRTSVQSHKLSTVQALYFLWYARHFLHNDSFLEALCNEIPFFIYTFFFRIKVLFCLKCILGIGLHYLFILKIYLDLT